MASTTRTPAHGSKPLIQVTPSFVGDTLTWLEGFDALVGRAVESSVNYASKSLRYAASKDEDWAPFADLLSVEYGEGGYLEYKLNGTPEQIQAMTDMEYGTPTQAPRPFLRPQVQRQNDIFAHKLKILLEQEVPLA